MQSVEATLFRGGLRWSHAALLLLAAASWLHAQQVPTIRVPARLVSVPALALGSDNHVLVNLQPSDFRLFDNDRPQEFQLDSNVTPLSVVIAVQTNSEVRSYLGFLAKAGSVLDALLVGETGESAVVTYGDEVTTPKPFGAGDLAKTMRALAPGGVHARAIDAAILALAMLRPS